MESKNPNMFERNNAVSKSLWCGEGGARLMLGPLPCLPAGEVYFNQTNAGCCPALGATMGKTVARPALPHVAWWDGGSKWDGTGRINLTLPELNFHQGGNFVLDRVQKHWWNPWVDCWFKCRWQCSQWFIACLSKDPICLKHTLLWSESRCGLIHEPGYPRAIEFHRGSPG